MISPDTKATIEVVAAVASAVSAIIALAIAVWVFVQQRRLQRQQLRQDLFDRRFAVYAAVETLLVNLVKSNGHVRRPDRGGFLNVIESAEFLFGSEVATYLQEIDKLVTVLSEKQQEGITQNSYGEDVFATSAECEAILDALGTLNKRRNEVFRPYLLIHED